MKKLWPNKKSHQLWFLGALMLPLTACGGGDIKLTNPPGATLPAYTNAAIYAADGPSSVTATKSVDKETGAISWAAGTPGLAEFTVTALPGSDAINIIAYRITRDVVDGTDVASKDPIKSEVFIYVPSGYSCPKQIELAKINQSCDPAAKDTVQGTGITSVPLKLNLSGGLVPLIIAKDTSVSRTTDIEFIGTTSRNQSVVIKASNVNSLGIKDGAQ